jgi:hypothetical protein
MQAVELLKKLRRRADHFDRDALCLEAAEEIERLQALELAVPDICQLLDACKMDWQAQGCWSQWDQSVRDKLTLFNMNKLDKEQAAAQNSRSDSA